MNPQEIKEIIIKELPTILKEDPETRAFVRSLTEGRFADKQETESRFDRILDEMRRDREAETERWNRLTEDRTERWNRLTEDRAERWNRLTEDRSKRWDELAEDRSKRWDELAEERAEERRKDAERWNKLTEDRAKRWDELAEERAEERRKDAERWDKLAEERAEERRKDAERWDKLTEDRAKRWDGLAEDLAREREEQSKRWDENHKALRALIEENRRLDRRIDTTIGALGARWGLHSEQSFRNGLKGILEEHFGVKVLNVLDFDTEGEVFGRPDQIELDIIIKNGLLIICEIKSSISKSEMHAFYRKAQYYEKRHQTKATRLMVISPMVDDRAKALAAELGIAVFSHAEDVAPSSFL